MVKCKNINDICESITFFERRSNFDKKELDFCECRQR